MKKFTHTLAFRLFLLIAPLQTIILLALAYGIIQVQQDTMMRTAVESAARASDVLARSMRHSMLLNRKEDVQRIVASVGEQPGIESIRIYNKVGDVVFGSVPAELHTRVDMNAEACVACHVEGNFTIPRSPQEHWSRIVERQGEDRVLGYVTPIRNEQQCAGAACHPGPETSTILGVMDLRLSLAPVDAGLQKSKLRLLLLSLAAVLFVGLVAGGFLWLFVRRPVRRLMNGMERVASGHLHERLPVRGNDELALLADRFNAMTADLARMRTDLTAWSETLEQKVREKTDDLERAHRQVLRVEKMASLGSLSSSVAHELNNPLEGILTYAKLLIKRLGKMDLPPAEFEKARQELQLIADESQRCGTIVKNLLLFSQQRGASVRTVRMKEILERCVLLVAHHAQLRRVDVRTECPENATLECDPGQIQQVLVALMVNGVEAMAGPGGRGGGGTLSVSVAAGGSDRMVITVADTGVGMTDEIKAHIFEPFFTTKSEGKGVGLGLAIAYGIVEGHHGSIDVESVPGRGTTFTVTVPVRQPGGVDGSGVIHAPQGASV